MLYLAFDTETTGLAIEPSSKNYYDTANWPRVYQLSAILFDDMGFEHYRMDRYIKPDKWKIPVLSDFLRDLGQVSFHEQQGITDELLFEKGVSMPEALAEFNKLAEKADAKLCHNYLFDVPVMTCEMFRYKHFPINWLQKPQFCTKEMMTPICKIPSHRNDGEYKWPSLQEAYKFLFRKEFEGAHNSMADVEATMEVFLEIKDDK